MTHPICHLSTINDFLTIFIFPFKYERRGDKELKPDEIARILQGKNKGPKDGWAKQHFSPHNEDHYNEFHYFHPFVHNTIFNKKGNKKKGKKGNEGMEYLTREDFKELEVYRDETKREEPSITTTVKSIDMHLFDNQIGLLTITTEKKEETDFPSFLRYNDIARRVYPPFLGKDNPGDNTYAPKYGSKLLPITRCSSFFIRFPSFLGIGCANPLI
ncbi:hypothetical protein KJ693_06980 [bacterium]|nr:hypothetical protein [bacterium]MBU1615046.1 hypothetical protein [bacterium]